MQKNLKHDGYQCGLLQWSINFSIKKTSGGATVLVNKSAFKNENMSNKELAKELYKPIIEKFEKRKVYSPFIENILGADLADMQLISKFNKIISFLLWFNDIFSKYAWVIPLKDKKRHYNY